MKQKSRFQTARRFLIFWTLFIGIGVVAGVLAMLYDPSVKSTERTAGKIRTADYILVHHQDSDYKNAADEMDRLLGLKHTGFRSVRCRKGRYNIQTGHFRIQGLLE